MGIGQPEIYDLLYRLGVTANYTGFFHTSYAVYLAMQQPERLLLVTKWLYPAVAKQYQTNWKAVERNIRSVGAIIWRQNRPLLEELSRKPLSQKPSSAQLLAILSYGLLSMYPSPLAVHGLCEPVAFPGENDNVGVMNQAVNEGCR